MGFLGWMMNPAMLGLGALAVSLPIIIHLLNKRRFKIVSWAAMDFLLEADKQNRRRVQLQNLLLLLLRCLAMLLLGLLLARPLLPSALSRLLADKDRFERVFILDDSLSQQVVFDNIPAFEQAKQSISKLLTELAGSSKSDDWVTLYVTSNLDQPLLANEPVTGTTLPNLQESIEQLQCSDFSADYSATLEQVRRYLIGQREGISRVVYLYSDLRKHDWIPSEGTVEANDAEDAESSPQALLAQLGENISQGFVVDSGSALDQNLAIVSLQSDDLLVANRLVTFTAEVVNFGNETMSNIRALLQIDEQAPVYATIQSLAPGQKETVSFAHMFVANETPSMQSSMLATGEGQTPRQDHRIRIEIDRQSLSTTQLQADQLINDDTRRYAARVMDKIPVLLVDGDPSAVSERSETHFLKFLDVFGTGLKTEVISVSELETISLTNYRVIFLCNMDEISEDRVKTLEQWVAEGGALVFLPGNQVRATTFNATFFRDGAGMSPMELDSIAGDPTKSSMVKFEVSKQVHPSLRTLVGQDAGPLLGIKIFSWWTSRIPETGQNVFEVPLRLNDRDNSPAMIERSWGRGKVVAFTIPADADWTMWPTMSAVFVPMMVDLIDYLVGGEAERSGVALGEPIEYPVDLTAFDSRTWLRDSQNEKIEAVARPVDDSEQALESSIYRVQFPPVERTGFYELGMTRHTGENESTLFAANSPAAESELRRLDLEQLPNDFWGSKFRMVGMASLATQSIESSSTEFWPQVVWLILLVLVVEQFLGWWFGRNR